MLIKKHKISALILFVVFLLIIVVTVLSSLLNTDRTVSSQSKTALQSLNNLRAFAELYISETATSSGMYAVVPLPPQVCERAQGSMFEDDAVYALVSRATSDRLVAECAADATRYAILVRSVRLTGESVCIDNTLTESIWVNGRLTGPKCPESVLLPRKFPFTIFPFNLIPARQ